MPAAVWNNLTRSRNGASSVVVPPTRRRQLGSSGSGPDSPGRDRLGSDTPPRTAAVGDSLTGPCSVTDDPRSVHSHGCSPYISDPYLFRYRVMEIAHLSGLRSSSYTAYRSDLICFRIVSTSPILTAKPLHHLFIAHRRRRVRCGRVRGARREDGAGLSGTAAQGG